MKLYSSNNCYKLYYGNMLDMLEEIEPNSIDSIITDPPYGLTSITKRFGKENSAECQYGKDGSFARLSKGFMGKEWDGSGIEYNIDTWKKCYEVLKPGGYLLAFGGSRTFHRIACAIEDAGFEIRDTIMWLYGSGFPKSMDISKQIDKKGGTNLNWFAEFLQNLLKEKNMTITELAEKGNFYGNVNHGGSVCHWVSGKTTPSPSQFNKLCEILNLPFKKIEEAEREVIGTKKSGGASAWINGMNNKENEEQKYTGFSEWDITAPATDLAKQWQGWGTALKPSFEPIIVARKPFKGSLVDNVIEYGVGGINIDECRVNFVNNEDYKITANKNQHEKFKTKPMTNNNVYGDYSMIQPKNYSATGRFPANTILTYDENDFDTTSWLRYFYCAKASKKDRDEGLDEFEVKVGHSKGNGLDRVCEFCGVSQLTPELCKCETKSWIAKPRKNTHPTVKPTELMQYLVRLVTPNGGTILDPFNGSGSTGKAVMYENKERNKNYKYIGIELTEEYLPISKARIEYVCNLIEDDNQTTIYDFM